MGLLLVESLFFWGLFLFAVTVALVALVEKDMPFAAGFVLVTALLLAEYLTELKPISYLIQHPWQALMGLLLYLAVGAMWCIAKWISFVYWVRDVYDAKLAAMVSKRPDGQPTEDDRSVAKNAAVGFANKLPPQIAEYRQEILVWIIYWPFSMIWTILNDPVRRMAVFVYQRIGGLLQAISDRAFHETNIPRK